MEENKQTTPEQAGRPLEADEAANVGGGDGDCSTNTVSISVGGVTVTFTGTLASAYNDAVDTASQAIENVAKAF